MIHFVLTMLHTAVAAVYEIARSYTRRQNDYNTSLQYELSLYISESAHTISQNKP